jgi:hypothetical protein
MTGEISACRRIIPVLLALAFGMSLANAQQQSSQDKTQTPPTSGKAADTGQPPAEPLFRDYKGVSIGMSVDDVRKKLGKPAEKDDRMDFFVFSDKERARVYYDNDKKVYAVIVTYIGKSSGAPAPSAVLGSDIEAKPDGSMYKMVNYPAAGYWVAYSRTPGDEPMVMVTMQKSSSPK